MKKYLKKLYSTLNKRLTLLIVPQNGDSIRSFQLSFKIIIIIAMIISANVYLLLGYSVNSKRLLQYQKILSQKNNQIDVLKKEHLKIHTTLMKSYQISDELNDLKQQRRKILDTWKTVQNNSDPMRTVNRSRRFNSEFDYSLPDYREGQNQNKLKLLNENYEKLQANLEVERKKQDSLLTDILNYKKRLEYIPSLNPLRYSRITSWFGLRMHPKLGFSRIHSGIDLGTSIGTKVYATAGGKVSFAGVQSGYGNLVIIDHGYGYQTYYGHNSKLLVKQGDQIKKGQNISLSGNTGISTGPHLHYEVRVDGQPVNPILFLKN